MAIMNRPKRGFNEGFDHYSTKIMVAEVADKYLSAICSSSESSLNYKLMTMYEFQYKPIFVSDTDTMPRLYTGDVTLLFFSSHEKYQQLKDKTQVHLWADIQSAADMIIDIEIDGIVGHGSPVNKSKNRIRDALLRAHRINVYRILSMSKRERNDEDGIRDFITSSYYYSLRFKDGKEVTDA